MAIPRCFRLPRSCGIGLLLALAGLVTSIALAQIARPPLSAYENFDVRRSAAKGDATGAATIAKYRALAPAARGTSGVDSASRIVSSMSEAKAALAREMPHLRYEKNPLTNATEIVGTITPGTFLRAADGASHEEMARSFLIEQAALYGITAGQVAGLVKFSDYANPAGNMSWVEFRQEFNGIPVFQGQVRLGFGAEGHLMGTTGNLASGLDPATLGTKPALALADAVVSAAKSVGYTLEASRFTSTASESEGRKQTLSAGPFAREVQTELVYFPLEPGLATLAYSLILWVDVDAYYILVDANDGTLLWRKNIVDHQTQTATFGIYDRGSPAPLAPSTILPGGAQAPGVARTTVTLIGNEPPYTFNSLGWIQDGTNIASGNNVHAGLDLSAPDGIDAGGEATGSPSRVFNYSYNPPPLGSEAPTLVAYRQGAIANVFYWSNYHHDQMYLLGFTEQAGNFQNNNFGRGGLGNDAVNAEVHDFSGTNNSDFSTPPDGMHGRMRLLIFTGPTPDRDSALDADIILHEMTHGASNRLHGNGSGLTQTDAAGMGEGWSDFFSRCLLSSAGENVDGVFTQAAYSTYLFNTVFTNNYYYGIRRFPYAVKSNVGANGKPHNPLTLADIDPSQVNLTDGAYPRGLVGSTDPQEPHNIGEVWCMMLLEMRARLIHRLGWAAGNQRAMQIVLDGMRYDSNEPTLLQGRDDMIAANVAGFGGADVADIRTAFAIRGAGVEALENNGAVSESFFAAEVPGEITFSDSLGNNNGIAEPGEFILISVPLMNKLQTGNPFDGPAFVTVGTNTTNYGSISAASATPTVREFLYRIPPDAPCGSLHSVPVTISSPGGVSTMNFLVRIGVPSLTPILTESFDGPTPPALPAGWAATTTGPANSAWHSVASPTIDTGNCLYSQEVGAVSDADLYSPFTTVNADNVLLTFKHRFNLQSASGVAIHGGVLEMRIGSGNFVDVVAGGGRFVQGGYNSVIQGFQNPIWGRNCWSGNQATTLTTIVELPASVKGQGVQFRWREGCTASGVQDGWYIDSFSLTSANYQCGVIDTDGDGIPDSYELSHGMNPNDPTDAALDSDGDGQTNLQEYLAGTNPNDASSVLRISSVKIQFPLVYFSFPTQLGATYQVEYCDDLAVGTWLPLYGGVAGTGADVTLTDYYAGLPKRFYRVRTP
jgi:Fungalysin metallopeptidase (M36)/Bacterial TSP3 repeat